MNSLNAAILLLLLCSTELLAQRGPGDGQLCESVRVLLQASSNDFNSVKRNVTRHSDGATDWVPSVNVAGTQDCEGQSDASISSSISCTVADSDSSDEVAAIYRKKVQEIRSCLDSSFVYSEQQGGKSTRRATPVREATFEIKGKGDDPDGPAVRLTLEQIHTARRSGYELTIWIDARQKE
jgi:hypothetical protein